MRPMSTQMHPQIAKIYSKPDPWRARGQFRSNAWSRTLPKVTFLKIPSYRAYRESDFYRETDSYRENDSYRDYRDFDSIGIPQRH